MDVKDVRKRLKKAVDKAGGQRPFGRLHKISAAYINDVLADKRAPGPTILKALGLKKKVATDYQEVK